MGSSYELLSERMKKYWGVELPEDPMFDRYQLKDAEPRKEIAGGDEGKHKVTTKDELIVNNEESKGGSWRRTMTKLLRR